MTDSPADFLALAEQLDLGTVSETDLPARVLGLPNLDEALLAVLTETAQNTFLVAPRRGWALAAVADQAAQLTNDQSLQAQAAFHLARAANAWYQPAREKKPLIAHGPDLLR